MYRTDSGLYIIGDHTPLGHPHVNGGGRGQIPRDWVRNPAGSYTAAPYTGTDVPLIDQSEWANRLKVQTEAKARVSDILRRGNFGQMIPSLDQGQVGYCWAHSTTGAVMAMRAAMHLPYVPLSAYAVAATIKQGADEGGWGALSLDFAIEKGIPSQEIWPQGDRNYRKYDNATTWDNAALHKVAAGWFDQNTPQYDRTLNFAQRASLWLLSCPTVDDYNWWGHSVMGADLVNGADHYGSTRGESGKLLSISEFELVWGFNDPVTGGFGVCFRNSWGMSYGDAGFSVLTGSKAQADGCVAPRTLVA